METLVDALKQNYLPKSFLSKVLQYAIGAEIENHIITKHKTYWMLTYGLTRMKTRNKEADSIIDNCITEVCGNKPTLNGKPIQSNYHPLELWSFAARWAELQYRTNK